MRRSLSLKKVASFHPDPLLEKAPAELFSGDFYDIFNNIFLVELLRVIAFKEDLVFLSQRGFY